MSSFDPYTQNFTLLMADGVTPFNVSVSDVDSFYFYNQASCINYGAQAGASLLMLIILLVLAKESSRWKPIHLLNILSLIFSFLRSLLQALYFLTAWDEFYAQMSSDMSAVPQSAYANSITTEVIHILLTTSINISLALQAYTVCKSNGLANKYRYGLTALSLIVTVLAIGFRFGYSIVECIYIMKLQTTWDYAWINTGCLVTETVTIWFYSLIFTGKLGHTLLVRKRQGWKQYTAVQVLAIMGGCTMILPSIFAVLEYVSPDSFPEAGTIALTMVALLLPLSSIWAGMLTNSSLLSFNLSTQDSTGTNGSISAAQRKVFGSVSTGAPSSHLEFGNERKGSGVPFHSISPTTIDSVIDRSHSASSPARDSTEIDLENMGVRVDREFSVQSNRKGSASYGLL